MELRTAPTRFVIGDYVGAMDEGDPPEIVFGRVVEVISDDEIMIRLADGELTGPWPSGQMWHDPSHHVDYPHYPGTLYDCPACEVSGELDGD